MSRNSDDSDEDTVFFDIPNISKQPSVEPAEHHQHQYQDQQGQSGQQQYQQRQSGQQQYQQRQSGQQQYQKEQSRRQNPPQSEEDRAAIQKLKSLMTMMGLFLAVTAVSVLLGFVLLDIDLKDLRKPLETYDSYSTPDTKKAKKENDPEDIDEKYILSYPEVTATARSLIPDNARLTVNDNVRSGKIDSKEQLKHLRDNYGVERVINLALDSTYKQKGANCGKDKGRMCERIWAEQLGLEFVYIPLTNRGPDPDDWETIKEYLYLGNNLLHCTHGADRTGAVIGRFRLETQPDVSPEEILEESLQFGFKAKNFRYKGGKLDPNRYLREWMLGGER